MTNVGFGTSAGGGTPLSNLTPDQIQVLRNMINTEQNHSTRERMTGEHFMNLEWIIDTKASHHITSHHWQYFLFVSCVTY